MTTLLIVLLAVIALALLIISGQIFLKDKKNDAEIALDFYNLYLENYNARLYMKALYYIKKAAKLAPENMDYIVKLNELIELEKKLNTNGEKDEDISAGEPASGIIVEGMDRVKKESPENSEDS